MGQVIFIIVGQVTLYFPNNIQPSHHLIDKQIFAEIVKLEAKNSLYKTVKTNSENKRLQCFKKKVGSFSRKHNSVSGKSCLPFFDDNFPFGSVVISFRKKSKLLTEENPITFGSI